MRIGNVIYVSGQIPWNQEVEVVGIGDINAQAVQSFDNLRRVLETELGLEPHGVSPVV